jgi:hypothetical protein
MTKKKPCAEEEVVDFEPVRFGPCNGWTAV